MRRSLPTVITCLRQQRLQPSRVLTRNMAKLPKPKGPETGLVFPKDPKGGRSSTFGNKGAFTAAINVIDPAQGEKIKAEKNWRNKYTKFVVSQVESSLKNKDLPVKVSEAGLQYVYENFEFIRDGQSYKLQEALDKFTKHNYGTGVIKGSKPKPTHGYELEVPYKDKNLKGEKLLAQLDKWATYGTIEPSVRDSIKKLVENPKLLDLSDKYFVLLGAGSAMGPYITLMNLGANVIAIDLDRPNIWERLVTLARNSPGTLIFPIKGGKKQAELKSDQDLYANAGGNLFTDTPEIRSWLLDVEPGKQLTVGAYAYLDGEMHVKVSVAMDAIIKDLTKKRKATPAYLCTPTDAHVIPEDAHTQMEQVFEENNLTNILLKCSPFYLPISPYLVKNARKPVVSKDGDVFYVVDGIVSRQGPNYILAKRIQHWRAMVAREVDGCAVSTNIAPSTATASVVSNKLFAIAYGGFHWFKPLEVFQQETSNALMAGLLIFDVQSPGTWAAPSKKLRNPLELFTYNSVHGGVWRMAYTIDSIGEPSAVLYLLSRPGGLVFLSVFVGGLAMMLSKLFI